MPKQQTTVKTTGLSAITLPVDTTASSANNNFGIAGPGWASFGAKDIDDRMVKLKELGVSWLRFDVTWTSVQPNGPTAYDWSNVDRLVKTANKYGIQLLPILDNTPSWAAVSNCNHVGWCQPSDPALFAKFAAAAASRYAAQGVHHWEIWNEENNQRFWWPVPNPSAYSQLLIAANAAIKQADDTATIIVGGLGGAVPNSSDITPANFVAGLYNNGAGNAFDAIATHPYSFPALASNPATWNAWSQSTTNNDSVRNIMVSHGDLNKKIWITEYGAPTNGPGAYADVNFFNYTSNPRHVTEALQNLLLSDVVNQYKSQSYFGPFFWYTYSDDNNDTSNNENFYGLTRADGSHKPAYETYKTLIRQ